MRFKIILILLLIMWLICHCCQDVNTTTKIKHSESETINTVKYTCDTFRDTIVLNHVYFSKTKDIY